MTVRIRLTGRVGLQGEAGEVTAAELPGRQGRIAPAYLALQHRSVARVGSRDALVDVEEARRFAEQAEVHLRGGEMGKALGAEP